MNDEKEIALISHVLFRVNEVLQTLLMKHDLKKYGFELRLIAQPTTIDGVEHWLNGWVFADTQSPHWNLVQESLLPKSAVIIPGPLKNAYDDKVARVLGHPVLSPQCFA